MPLNRKAYRSDLTDQEWNRIKRLLPKPAATGRPRVDDREVVNGILYVTWTGCRWDDLPHDIAASPKTCHRRLLEYQRLGVWDQIWRDLMREAHHRHKLNLTNCYHDASVIKSKKGRTIKRATPASTKSRA
jgi:transposase